MAESKTKEKYISTVGRRKTSVAQIRLGEASKSSITVNGLDLETYFKTKIERITVTNPLKKAEESKFKISAIVRGGGSSSQAGAIRHGIARALVKFDENLRKQLKKEGFLKRDARMKERRKFGLKKARKAPQWSKR